ncbi:MAG TPA: hypothetical protein ENN17_12445 [bacterium]|nr:hypothetical protein [bacterium]
MKTLTSFYLLNATFLILHEIESAYEKEWEILKLPGKVTGFLLMHIPIVLILLYGLLEIEKQTRAGFAIGILTGIGGLIPFLVHKIVVRRKGHFHHWISDFILYANVITGVVVAMLSVRSIA